uniref:Uncharacterized protein n=1 Tax=Moorena producens (strain JHB) TaxID=1454205 RepID=A0A1D9FYI2_MOOP1
MASHTNSANILPEGQKGRGQEAEGRRGNDARGFNPPAMASHQIEDLARRLIPKLPTVAISTRVVSSAFVKRTRNS